MGPSMAASVPQSAPEETCARCGRQSPFRDEEGLCPFCRAENLEREFGLRPGVFRELVQLAVMEEEARSEETDAESSPPPARAATRPTG